MTPTQKLITTAVVLLAVVAGLYYYSTRPQAGLPAGAATSTASGLPAQAGTSTATSTYGVGVTLVTPDYKKPIAFSPSISSGVRAQLNAELAIVQAKLAKNSLNMGAWDDLGTLHKQGGDYAVAAEYWEYVVSVYSGTAAPYYSLGDLYENFLHDYTKAEAYYKMAIKIDPKNVNAYASLYTMYHYTLHDAAKAAAILVAGLAANPNNNYLLGLQAELK